MKKTQEWGKHCEFFENERASGALRACPSTTRYHTCVLRARIRKSQKQDETLGKNVKNRKKHEKKYENEKRRLNNRKNRSRPKLPKKMENNSN